VPFRTGAMLFQVPINKALHLILMGMFLFFVCGMSFAQTDSIDSKNDELGTLKVLLMHRMSAAEIQAHPDDYLGARVVVTLRYESPKDRSVYLYAPPNCPPEGYFVKRTGGQIIWVAALVNGTQGSPGFGKLKRGIGEGWIFLPPNSAIEWQTRTEDSSPGSENARSVFVKGLHEASPHEVLSDWFKTSDLK